MEGSNRPQPTKLMLKQGSRVPLDDVGGHDVRRQHRAQPQPPSELPKPIIIRELVGDGLKSAYGPQGLAPNRDRGSEGEGPRAQEMRDPNRWREPVVDEEGAQSGPEAEDRPSSIQAGDDADRRVVQRRDHLGEIVLLHANVAVGEDEAVVPAA